MDEKIKEIEEIKDWVNKAITAEMGDDYYVTITHDDWHRTTTYFPRLLSHIEELERDNETLRYNLRKEFETVDHERKRVKELESGLRSIEEVCGDVLRM